MYEHARITCDCAVLDKRDNGEVEMHETNRNPNDVTVSSGRRSTKTADERRAEIITVAASLFDKEGYFRTSMEQIAAEVGLAKPTLYHYFNGKDEILFGVHQEFIVQLFKSQEERSCSDEDPADQLRDIMRDIFRLMDTKRGHVRVFFEHWRDLPDELRDTVIDQRDRYRDLVEDVIRSGISDGSFQTSEPRLATLAMFGMCNWAYQWYRPDGASTPDDIADFFFDLLYVGLRT